MCVFRVSDKRLILPGIKSSRRTRRGLWVGRGQRQSAATPTADQRSPRLFPAADLASRPPPTTPTGSPGEGRAEPQCWVSGRGREPSTSPRTDFSSDKCSSILHSIKLLIHTWSDDDLANWDCTVDCRTLMNCLYANCSRSSKVLINPEEVVGCC